MTHIYPFWRWPPKIFPFEGDVLEQCSLEISCRLKEFIPRFYLKKHKTLHWLGLHIRLRPHLNVHSSFMANIVPTNPHFSLGTFLWTLPWTLILIFDLHFFQKFFPRDFYVIFFSSLGTFLTNTEDCDQLSESPVCKLPPNIWIK